MDKKIVRIIDANCNRAREAIRVCEDIARFYLDHRVYATQLKRARHAITRAVKKLPMSYRHFLTARESQRDVGRDMVLYHTHQVGVHDLFISNMKRAQEAVRVLEEFSKMSSKQAAAHFQRIRFALYQLEKKMLAQL